MKNNAAMINFGKRPLFFLTILIILFSGNAVFAQNAQRTVVSGNITSPDNSPVEGVSVTLKGTNQTVVSDAKGNFSLATAAASGILVFTHTAYQSRELAFRGSQRLSVKLEPASSKLDEVVIIGYGRQSRATVTTSVAKVGESEFRNAPGQNPLVQLQGKVAGLTLQISDGQPGANPQIFIRGGSSTSPEGDAPLFVVDGVAGVMRNISDLNPDDIESVQVLKDASSTAIYGARAANGVIIIKTKSGKSGKPSINIKFTNGIETQGKKYEFASAKEYVETTRRNIQKFNHTNPDLFLSGGTFGMSTGNPRNSKNTLEFLDTYITNYGADYVADLIDNQGWEVMEDPITGRKLILKETDYQDVTFRKANKKEFDFNIGGGNDKATYYLGLGHLDQQGIVLGSFYKNYSGLFNGEYKLSDSWSVNANVSYQLRNSVGLPNYQNVLSRSVTMPYTYRLTYEDGTPAPGEGVNSFRNRNHEVYYRDRYSDDKVLRSTFKVGANWDIIPGLSFTPTLYWFTTEGLENRFEAYNEVVTTRAASAAHNLNRQTQLDGLLNYSREFGNRHNFNAVLGTSYINWFNYNMSGSGRGAPTDYIPTLNATAEETQRVTTTQNSEIMMSYFGRATYDYAQKYMFSFSLRKDGSSRFAEKKKWGVFPGLSAGWNIHSENFWEPLANTVSKLKLRTSWGQTGNNEITISDAQGAYSTGHNYLGEAGILNTTLANGNLVWETTTSFDLGMDIGLLHDRISILLDYFSKVTSDRLFAKPLDASTGFNSITSNYGSIRSRGFEVEVQASPVKNKNFSWDIAANVSFIKSIVLKLPENTELKNRTGGNTVFDPVSGSYVRVGGFAEGERFGGRWAYHLIGVYATDEDAASAPYDVDASGRQKVGGDAIWQDVDGNGRIDNRDMVFMGYIRPNITGGIQNTITYKGLSLRFVGDFAIGHVIDNSFRGRSLASARNNNMMLKDAMGPKVWQNQGDIASIPRYTVQSDADYNYRNHLRNSNGLGSGSGYTTNNSLYYSKGDFFAFREISLDYTIKRDLLRKYYVQSVNLFLGVYNLGYLTTYTGLMPEIYTGNDQGSYPRPRQFDFGFRLGF